MKMRSWLFVPGDSQRKLDKVIDTGADVVIVDLEDAVTEPAKPEARRLARKWLELQRRDRPRDAALQLWVRINPVGSHFWREDLAAIIEAAPDGIMVPKAAGPEQLQLVSAEIYEHEQRAAIPPGSTRIVPLVSETAAAALTISDYASNTVQRLAGLTWGAEDLSAAIGASRKHTAAGEWADLFRMVRAQTLLVAHACQVAAIDTLHADFRDLEGLRTVARASYEDGFAGMLAIHPAQVPVINAAFSPSTEEIAQAQAIVDAFAAKPGTGAVQLDGRMIDRPHLEQARRLLERAR